MSTEHHTIILTSNRRLKLDGRIVSVGEKIPPANWNWLSDKHWRLLELGWVTITPTKASTKRRGRK